MKTQLVNCKSCGAEIAKTAKACPHCGAKQHRGVLKTCIIILLIVIVISAIIANGEKNDEPALVDQNTQGSTSDTQSPAPDTQDTVQPAVFTKGDVVSLNDINVTLVDVVESTGSTYNKPTSGNVFVTFEIEIENKSDKEIGVSSLMMFDAYFDDYAANLSIMAITDSGKTQLDGTVAAGKKMSGVVGFEAPADWSVAEIHVTPDFWAGDDIIFQVTK